MAEQNLKTDQDVIAQTTEQANPPITAQAEDESAAAAAPKPETTQEEEDAHKEANETKKNEAKYKVEDAISRIMSENTCDFKDFHFPCKKMDVLLYRMHHEISGRIQTVKDNDMEVDELVAAYRNRHTKADDIKFLIKTYKTMTLHGESATVRPLATSADGVGTLPGTPIVPPVSRAFLPELFEPIGSQAAGLEPRERAQIRRNSSARRSVRFQASARECLEEEETKEEK